MTAISMQKSTIVRAEIGVRLRHFALALTEREAPALGARLAVRMWMTLPATPAATLHPQLAPPGSRTLLKSGVAAESWGDGDGPLVYLMHGWAGYRGQLGAFVTPLTEAGFRVVALDAPGHGESAPGRYGRGRALMPDFIAALRTGIAHYGAPAGVVAHSLGASAVAIATLDGVPTNRLVLISPVANVMSGIDIFTHAAGVGPNVRARMPRRIERIAGLPTSHFDIAVRAAEREELAPMLVLHDVSDKRVPFDNGVLVAAAWPDSRLERTEGLGHLRILSDPAVIGTAVSYLSRQRQLADGPQ